MAARYAAYREEIYGTGESLNINIAATLRCNANCSYCYEKGVRQGDFSQETLEHAARFIRRHQKESGKRARLTWFGGEPLPGETAIDGICEKLRADGIEFVSSIITNGSLVTERIIKEKFPLWNMKDVHITLDGMADTYAARKNYIDKNKNIFGEILEKTLWMAQAGLIVHIRLNIDEQNAAEILELLPVLQDHFGNDKNVVYYPAFLTGINSRLDDSGKIACIKKMFETINDPAKFNISNRLYAMPVPWPACGKIRVPLLLIPWGGYIRESIWLAGAGKLWALFSVFRMPKMWQEESRPCGRNVKIAPICQNAQAAVPKT